MYAMSVSFLVLKHKVSIRYQCLSPEVRFDFRCSTDASGSTITFRLL